MREVSLVLDYVAYLLPAIVVGIVAYYFFKGHTKNEEGRRRYLIHKEAQKEILPLRLQAYERLTLFLERIDPTRILVRVKPFSDSISDYEDLVIKNIEQEFDHNLTQQIYISPECWTVITNAKNNTIQLIRQTAMHEKNGNPDRLRKLILEKFMDEPTPSAKALLYVKREVSELFN